MYIYFLRRRLFGIFLKIDRGPAAAGLQSYSGWGGGGGGGLPVVGYGYWVGEGVLGGVGWGGGCG